ncbi:MAG: beta-glucosidase [Hyphomicrobiales bacterium]|nr:beta-glucosidase [Hyphomicrobiales bacterium]
MPNPVFGSFFLSGFECSTQRRYDHRRIDMVEATGHAAHCEADYALSARHGMRGARDGLRWHLIEAMPGRYDWSSVLPQLRAARRQGMTVIWDLCHYGYPDWLDIWSTDFVERFAAFAVAAVELIREESCARPLVCPVNEISFWAWLGGKEGKIAPHTIDRGHDLKRALIAAKLAAIRAIRQTCPDAYVITAEPLINIVPDSLAEEDIVAAAQFHNSQYEALDLLFGRLEPERGGSLDMVDAIGVNYYPHNQWRIRGGYIPLGHHDYRPFSELLMEIWERYRKPIVLAETGAEHSARNVWLYYVCNEIRTAMSKGAPILGVCIYPITDYPGWDNDRICQTGLFRHIDEHGRRGVYRPLADELARQQAIFATWRCDPVDGVENRANG